MASTRVASPARPSPTTIQELINTLPGVLDAHIPAALQLEPCADAEAKEALSSARARFLESAQSFLRPCFQEAVLDNLTRDDPLAPPKFEHDMPDQTAQRALGRRKADEAEARIHAEVAPLLAAAGRVEDQARNLQDRLVKLARQADATSGPAVAVKNVAYAGDAMDDSHDSDHQNEETLKEQAETVAATEARKAELESEVAALRADLSQARGEVAALANEQATVAAAAGAVDAKRRADASRETEKFVGVSGMSDAQLGAAVEEERSLVRRNSGISAWYRGTVAILEKIGGVRISHRMLFGGGTPSGHGAVEGLEIMVDLDSAQVLEVTVSAADGRLGAVRLCHVHNNAKGGAGLTPSEVEELARAADAVPAPGNLRLLVREALKRARCAVLRDEHVKLMRRRYLVGYRAQAREVTITMPVGIVASFRLHPDYPQVAGGAEVVTLTGVGGWSASETEQLCERINGLALATLVDTMDRLEAAVADLEGSGA